MKHFLGGAAVGIIFGVARAKVDKDHVGPFIFAVGLCGLLFGVAAWGLLP